MSTTRVMAHRGSARHTVDMDVVDRPTGGAAGLPPARRSKGGPCPTTLATMAVLIRAQLQTVVELTLTRYDLLVASGRGEEEAVKRALATLEDYRFLQDLDIEGFDFGGFVAELSATLAARAADPSGGLASHSVRRSA